HRVDERAGGVGSERRHAHGEPIAMTYFSEKAGRGGGAAKAARLCVGLMFSALALACSLNASAQSLPNGVDTGRVLHATQEDELIKNVGLDQKLDAQVPL